MKYFISFDGFGYVMLQLMNPCDVLFFFIDLYNQLLDLHKIFPQ